LRFLKIENHNQALSWRAKRAYYENFALTKDGIAEVVFNDLCNEDKTHNHYSIPDWKTYPVLWDWQYKGYSYYICYENSTLQPT